MTSLPATDSVVGNDVGLDHKITTRVVRETQTLVNAARNILAAGPAVTVCGAGVRPQRNLPGGQSVPKQKTLRCEP